MQSKRAWIVYTLIRVLAVLVPFAIVMLAFPTMPYNWVIGLAVGTIVSAAVSYLFLRDARTRMGEDLAELRGRRDTRTALDREEDAALDDEDADASDPDAEAEAESRSEPENETNSDDDLDDEQQTDEDESGTSGHEASRGSAR